MIVEMPCRMDSVVVVDVERMNDLVRKFMGNTNGVIGLGQDWNDNGQK